MQLKSTGFAQTNIDPCIYVTTTGEQFTIAIYVDDILLASKSDQQMNEIMREIANKFKVKDIGEQNFAVTVQIVQNAKMTAGWLGQ
jgi:hypothetical protein